MVSSRWNLPALVLAGLLALAMPLHAGAIWTLQGVTFDDGTPLTGSFMYDAALDLYTGWNLVVQAAAFMPAYNYLPDVDAGFVGSHSAAVVDFVAFPPASGRYVRLTFAVPLTDLGGTVNLALAPLSFECNNCATKRFITAGSVIGEPVEAVPEPSSFALISGALLIGGWLLRRRR